MGIFLGKWIDLQLGDRDALEAVLDDCSNTIFFQLGKFVHIVWVSGEYLGLKLKLDSYFIALVRFNHGN